eukprot:scaffold29670_cov55-Attheya_sp.AAC.1
MAKTHSVHGVFNSKWRRRGIRHQNSWMVNKVHVHKAYHGRKNLVRKAYERKKHYGNKSSHSCLAHRKQLLVYDFDSSVLSSLIQETISDAVRPHTMDGVTTAIVPNG